jgi:Fe2+ transport system protein FeoA
MELEEIDSDENYEERIKKFGCIIGVKIHILLSMIVEVGIDDR